MVTLSNQKVLQGKDITKIHIFMQALYITREIFKVQSKTYL